MKPRLYAVFQGKKQVSQIFFGPYSHSEAREWLELNPGKGRMVREVCPEMERKGYIATAYGHAIKDR